jgi:hypothetical protein
MCRIGVARSNPGLSRLVVVISVELLNRQPNMAQCVNSTEIKCDDLPEF